MVVRSESRMSFVWLPMFLLLASVMSGYAQALPETLNAMDYGLLGDGIADDGPAIDRMLAAARTVDGPLILRFPENKTIRVGTAPERYVFSFEKATDLTVDGSGCTFLLDPYLRFLRLMDSQKIVLRDLKVDFDTLPFVEGTVTNVDKEKCFVDVRLRPEQGEAPSGTPTREDGEQAFFSMLWNAGPYGLVSEHYWTERIESTDAADMIRVYGAKDFAGFDRIESGVTRISVPIPGIAHRYGPGACFLIQDNTDVTLEDVELWSAPWFGFFIAGNSGELLFKRVNIRPKPDSGRIMSTWRDGFHVKGNSASMRWEDCVVSGMNDDAFNISTHSSVVLSAPSPDRVVVTPKFPLWYVPWRAGAELAAADIDTGQLLPSRHVVAVEAGPMRVIDGKPAAPAEITLVLDAPADSLKPGIMVWDPQWANPDTVLRNCTIEMSCRMQSPVRLEGCTVTGILWFYCEPIEGPFPSGVRVTDCALRRGRGNPEIGFIFSGLPAASSGNPGAMAPPRAIHDVVIENNRILGGFHMEGVEDARLSGNRFLEENAQIIIRRNHKLVMTDNLDVKSRLVLAE